VAYGAFDVAEAAARDALLADVRARFGRLDVLVNNAGVAPLERRDLLDATEESFERVLGVNLRGPYFLTQAAARWMIEQKRQEPSFTGCIINVSSVSAVAASVNRGEYCVAKAGLSMATRLWAARLGEFDIPVYEVRPGIVRTDMTAGVTEKYDRLIAGGLLVQARWGHPADVGRAVAMLARGDLAYSTGQVIDVDGGLGVRRL
jgi:NAD(P)-dependent dehydrogenase (short-subunit alcohol dehydrogenase family)